MKIIQAFILIKYCFFSTLLFSQSNSVSENWCATEGTLTTNSTIHNGQRIYDGPYSFVGTRAPHEGMPKGTMLVKGTKKLGLMHGAFLMERKGAHFKGDRNFSMTGELSENVMIGTWKFKSKQYNSLAYKNEKYTYDKNYILEFNKAGQIIKGTRIDNDYSLTEVFETDENGYLNGKISTKYSDGGYMVEEEEMWLHGIKISSFKRDIKTKAILGEKTTYADTTLINSANYVPSENGFKNPRFESLNKTGQSIKDSLALLMIRFETAINSEEYKNSTNIGYEKMKIKENIKKTSSNLETYKLAFDSYNVKKHSEKLYSVLKNIRLLKVSLDAQKDIEKLLGKLKKSGQIDEKGQKYFALQGDSISLFKIDIDAHFQEIKFDKKTAKSLQKMFNEKMLYIDSNQVSIKLNLSGIDSNYFEIRSKIELTKNEIENNKKRIAQLDLEKAKYTDFENTMAKLEEVYAKFESELKNNQNLLSKEKKIFKVKLDREAYKYIFDEVNELGDLFSCLEIKFIYKLPLMGKLEN